jgi:drug/metabolite transporter (DMT)-like permease
VLTNGSLFMLGSALAFSLMTVCVKLAGQRLPSQEIVLARALVSLVLSLALLRRAGVAPLGTHRRWLILRGLCGFAGLSCVFYSVTHLPLAEATIIQYLHPTFTALLAAAVLGERLGGRTALASAISLLGVVLVARPGWLAGAWTSAGAAASALDPLAVTAAVGGAFFSGAAYVVVRRLAGREDPLVIVLYFPLVTVPATLPTVIGRFVWPQGVEWVWLLAIGVLTQLGQVWLTRGLQKLPAARGTALSYVQVVFAIVWGMAFFGETPGTLALLGAMLVIGGTLAVALSPDRPAVRPRPA